MQLGTAKGRDTGKIATVMSQSGDGARDSVRVHHLARHRQTEKVKSCGRNEIRNSSGSGRSGLATDSGTCGREPGQLRTGGG